MRHASHICKVAMLAYVAWLRYVRQLCEPNGNFALKSCRLLEKLSFEQLQSLTVMVPGDCSLLCWCCATAIIVFCMCCDTLCMGTGVSKRCVLQYCVAILLCCAIQFVQIAVAWLRQGCWNGTSSAVESCDSVCGLQVSVGRSHWNCYIMDAIWMLYARNIAFFRVNRASVAEKSWLAWATIAGDFSLTSNLSRTARAVELMVPGDFSLFGWCCAFCVLHVLRHGVHGKLVYRSDVFYSIVLQFFCVVQFSLCRSQWHGFAKAAGMVLVLQYSRALSFCLWFASLCWQITLELLHHGCDLNVRICTKHCVFSGKQSVRCGEKLARLRNGCRASLLCCRICFELRMQWNWWFQVTFSVFCWCCAIVFCMCCDTLCIGTGVSKRCVPQ